MSKILKRLTDQTGKSEAESIMDVINRHGTMKAAASYLNVHQSLITYWCKKYGIECTTTRTTIAHTTAKIR